MEASHTPLGEALEAAEEQEWRETSELADAAPPPSLSVELDVWIDRRLERLAELRAQQAREQRVMEARLAMVRGHFGAAIRALRARQDWLERELMAVAASYPYPRGRRSRQLAFGRIGLRRSRARIEIGDEAAALAWAEAHMSEDVSSRRWITRTPLLAHFEATGEVPDGCEYLPGEDRPFVEAEEVRDAS
jgi:Bacteriophage Mu Gam like protein